MVVSFASNFQDKISLLLSLNDNWQKHIDFGSVKGVLKTNTKKKLSGLYLDGTQSILFIYMTKEREKKIK